MMTAPRRIFAVLSAALLANTFAFAADDETRLAELDAYWAEVSRTVREGDFEGYKATCHEEGVLVSGVKATSHPLATALKRWKPEFDATKSGAMKAEVTFRFSQRLGDAETAHETGIFRYTSEKADGERSVKYVHFEGLLVKRGGKWMILMEYQKSKATGPEWAALGGEAVRE